MISKTAAIEAVNRFGAYVSIKDLAEILGRDRSNLFKAVKKSRFTTRKFRSEDCGNQRAAFLTRQEALAFVEAWMGEMIPDDDDAAHTEAIAECLGEIRDLRDRYQPFEEIAGAIQLAIDRLEGRQP
jgi:hypothetical protein